MRVPTIKPLKTSGARFLSSGSSLPASIAESFHERFGIRLLSCYHGTQAGPLAIDRAGKDPETVGKAFEGVELRVAGAKGDRVAAGEIGPIWARSKTLSMLAVPKIAPAQARRRRPDRRRRRGRLVPHRRPRASSTRTAA